MAGRRRPLILPGEEICGCVPRGTPADDFDTFIQLCPCMYKPDEEAEKKGEMICVQCDEKIHSCGCALVHSPECELG